MVHVKRAPIPDSSWHVRTVQFGHTRRGQGDRRETEVQSNAQPGTGTSRPRGTREGDREVAPGPGSGGAPPAGPARFGQRPRRYAHGRRADARPSWRVRLALGEIAQASTSAGGWDGVPGSSGETPSRAGRRADSSSGTTSG